MDSHFNLKKINMGTSLHIFLLFSNAVEMLVKLPMISYTHTLLQEQT